MMNRRCESPPGEKGDDPGWETIEVVDNLKMEPGKTSRLRNPLELKEENGTASKEGNYWGTSVPATKYQSEPKKGNYQVNQAITGKDSMILVNESTDSNKRKGSGHSEIKGTDEINMISGTTTTDKTYKISSKKMRKTWERIDAPDDEERII